MEIKDKDKIINLLINCETVFQFKEGLKLYLNEDLRNKKELYEVIKLITSIKDNRQCLYTSFVASHKWVLNNDNYLELVKLMATAKDATKAWLIQQVITNYDIINMDKQLECAKLVYNTKYNKRARYISDTLTDKRLIDIDKNIEIAYLLKNTKEIFLDNAYKISSNEDVINTGEVASLTRMAKSGIDIKYINMLIPILNKNKIKKRVK